MSNPELTRQELEKFKTLFDQLPEEPPEGTNPILWQAQRDGVASMIQDLEEQLNGPSAETLAFEAFWQGLEMPEAQEGASPEDQWIAQRCKLVAEAAWKEGINYQSAQQVETEDEEDLEPEDLNRVNFDLIRVVADGSAKSFHYKPRMPEED